MVIGYTNEDVSEGSSVGKNMGKGMGLCPKSLESPTLVTSVFIYIYMYTCYNTQRHYSDLPPKPRCNLQGPSRSVQPDDSIKD
jgi:hypothetical protein